MSTIKELIEQLEQNIENKETQRKYLYEQVLLQDAEIDKIDKVIEKIDSSYLPNISSINSAITNVETAYDNRISIGCSNNLYWEPFTVIVSPGIAATAYRATEDPSQERSINFYGAKYYRKPLNQDYDSNIIEEFSGTISLGSSSLAIVGSALTFKYQIGDTIVDNIDNPVVFSSANLPTIVSFGTTSLVGTSTDFGGTISFGSTIIAHVGVGSTVGINTGDVISLSGIS